MIIGKGSLVPWTYDEPVRRRILRYPGKRQETAQDNCGVSEEEVKGLIAKAMKDFAASSDGRIVRWRKMASGIERSDCRLPLWKWHRAWRADSFGRRPKIALTGMGSEHGEENSMAGCGGMAAKDRVWMYTTSVLWKRKALQQSRLTDDEEGHEKMEDTAEEQREWMRAVTMHFPFPIGVSTVGRVVTPAKGQRNVSSPIQPVLPVLTVSKV